jgi:hypothetical protein
MALKGRRVYPPAPDEDIPHPIPLDCHPGDYWFDPTLGYWLVYCPKGGVGTLINHQVVEHEDGTITVSPSILQNWGRKGESWHGYLEHGEWREV